MRTLLLGLLTLWSVMAGDFEALTREADRLYREGSYGLAHDAYARVDASTLSGGERRWLEFRLAETRGRSEAATRNTDDAEFVKAENELKRYVSEEAPRDRVWAEAQETLGDLQRGVRVNRDYTGAWGRYAAALEYWEGSTNLVLAAERYWSILRKASEPPQVDPMWYYGVMGAHIPLPVLENALKVARNEEEKARAHFMIAMTLRMQGGDWEQRFRIPEEFEAALKLKKDTRWYDDALYYYGDWMRNNGRATQDENGSWRTEPDYKKAVELFRRLVTEFRRGETPWFEQARTLIEELTRESVDVNVSNNFLPGSEVEFYLATRNVKEVELTLYRVNVAEDFSLSGEVGDLAQGFQKDKATVVKTWKRSINDKRPHSPTNERIRLEENLPLGAYVIAANAGRASDRELLLVTDAAVVVQAAGKQVVTYACDSAKGAPLPESTVTLWERYYDRNTWRWNRQTQQADERGIAVFTLKSPQANPGLYVAIKSGDRQSVSTGSSYGVADNNLTWRIYAFPDKPAYRPGEKLQWKIIARRQRSEAYTVPAGEKLVAEFVDPRGAQIAKEAVTLNDYGSAWGSFELKSELPLGEYQVLFRTRDGGGEIGRAALFRLEEYKLPEFKVTVQTPDENGRKKTFLLGEDVEVQIAAEYYSGGPVANASAEIVIHQAPYYHLWLEPQPFDWLYSPQSRSQPYNPGQVVHRETVKIDAQGKGKLTFHTPLGGGDDLEYRIEARVTDSSRREIVGSDRIRVGRQRFYVFPRPAHKLYRPQDKVELEFRTLDANDKPLAAEGTVQVTRDYWFESWLSSEGREVSGAELVRLQQAAIFPPHPAPGQKPWRLKFRGYQQDQILTRTLKSGTNGVATLTFTPEREGYYRATWRSDEKVAPGIIPSRPIRGTTTVWVANARSSDIGYRSGQLEILVDKETFRAGAKAAVMLSTPSNDRYVLLTTSGKGLIDHQLVHMDGSVKLLEIDVAEKHVPNFFLNGVMVADQQIAGDVKEIVVPPTKNFLTVEVEADRADYRPGERGTMRVRTKDVDGHAVFAEVALSVYDESVAYIQGDLAGDPRQFFFGAKRANSVSSFSSFSYRVYGRLAAKEEAEFEAASDFTSMDLNALSYDLQKRKDFRMERRTVGLQGGTAPAQRSAKAASLNALGLEDSVAPLASAMYAAAAPGATPEEATVQVRTDFRSAVFWEPALKTDSNGRAEVSFQYPETLTAWKAVARAVTRENQLGIDDEVTRTKQPLSIRLQAPRFFLVGDSVTISAVINNNTRERLTVRPALEAKGVAVTNTTGSINIAPGGEERVDWTIYPGKPGEVSFKVSVTAGRYADGMEKSYPVYEHGIEKFLAVSGKSKGTEATASLLIPAERKEGSTTFSVQVTPSLAVTMLDALPYLVNYPYGCTEQTMSRFLPAVITAKTLKDLGLHPEDVMSRVFGGIEEASRKKAGKKNLDELDAVTRKGLARLYEFQHGDGGWGWWKEGESDRFMTAYVVWGLATAKSAGVEIEDARLTRAVSFLNERLVEAENNYDIQAFMLHALATVAVPGKNDSLTTEGQTAFDNLWEHRETLNAYTRALFAWTANAFGKKEEAKTLVRNLANGVKRDNSTGLPTAHWGEDGIHWQWSEGGVEATAFALRALLAIDPQHELVDPVANWLIKNRRGAQWSNTRDTAIVLLALNHYLRVSGEVKGELEYEVFVNGESLGSAKISGADVFAAPKRFQVPEKSVKGGANAIRIQRKSGEAPIYFAAECTFFSLEEPIAAAGNEIFVQRKQYRLAPVATLLKGYTYEKQELKPGAAVASGERIETVLTIQAKNNYEYLIFEDLKASGVEAVEVRSGEPLYAQQIRSVAVTAPVATVGPGEPTLANDRSGERTGATRWVYQELRDRKVAFFIDKLPEGIWEIRYETRAETPGEFHALPVVGHAMYVPEIRANSAETKITINDKTKETL